MLHDLREVAAPCPQCFERRRRTFRIGLGQRRRHENIRRRRLETPAQIDQLENVADHEIETGQKFAQFSGGGVDGGAERRLRLDRERRQIADHAEISAEGVAGRSAACRNGSRIVFTDRHHSTDLNPLRHCKFAT